MSNTRKGSGRRHGSATTAPRRPPAGRSGKAAAGTPTQPKSGDGSKAHAAPPSSRDRAARRRAAARGRTGAASDRRLRLIAIAAVVVVAATFVIVKLATHKAPATAATPVPAAVLHNVTGIPAATFDAIGGGTGLTAPGALPSGTPALTASGKPRIVYIGAEYCPYCAAERWPVVIALSRFGTFTGLGATESSTSDIFPGTKTFSFHGSTYNSQYVALKAYELETNQPSATGGYTKLESLGAADRQLMSTYDAPPYVASAGGIPFVDIGGKYVITGSSFDPTVLKGLTLAEIAAELKNPNSALARSVVGSANLITAAICRTGVDAPVCSSAGVKAADAHLS